MSSSHRFSRHFSLREKRRPASKGRSTDAEHHGLFALDDDAKKPSKEEEKKILEVSQHLSSLGYRHVPNARIEYALRSRSANGDVNKAWDLLLLFENSANGLLQPFAPRQKMLGAENRQKVTCWIDSLLFAMFLKSSVFEALLYHDYEDEPRKRLVTVIRLWVNMLRTGRLITTDITRHLQEALAACGWPDAAQVKQQDASEAFIFITDKLELPLLTLKTDLFHSGNEDNDDHKFITERLLDVAVPEDTPPTGVVSLEHCLEEYFNNKVEVKRELQRRTTLKSALSDEKGGSGIHVEQVEVSGEDSNPSTPRMSREPSLLPTRPLHLRERQTSIFSERKVEILEGVEKEATANTRQPNGRPRGASIRKEVLMPAWQFLNLIPWYTDQSSNVNSQINAHFSSKRPMLGICLKRYTVTKDGVPTRLGTKIDIPLEMIPPHFVADGTDSSESGPSPNLKLSLQAVVCHRGNYVTSGHYISLVRTAPAREESHESFSNITSARAFDSSHDVWLRHDDLSATEKVTVVDIEQALAHEWPYLLFYQVLPINGDDMAEEPPPYQESADSFSMVSEKLAGLQTPGRQSTEIGDRASRRASVAASEDSRGRRSSVADPLKLSVQDSGSVKSQKSEPASAGDTTTSTPAEEGKSNPLAALRLPPRSAKSSRPESDASDKVFSRIASRLSRDKLSNSEAVAAADEVAVEDAPKKERDKDPPRGPSQPKSSRDRKSRFTSSMSRHGSVLRRNKDKEIERECIMM